jgi:UDP-N-acetylglucosamine:LPS N-acetylglucosamine transferase
MHILFSVSGHGLGHLSQVAPVINQLSKHCKEFKVTIESALGYDELSKFISCEFGHHDSIFHEFPQMHDAITVDTASALSTFKESMSGNHLKSYKQLINKYSINAVVSNISYLPLLAAQELGIRNIAYCSLNWWDLVTIIAKKEDQHELSEMLRAYQQADVYIAPKPHVNYDYLNNVISTAPVGRVGENKKAEIEAKLSLSSAYLVLLGFGGMSLQLDLNRLPTEINGTPVHYLSSEASEFENVHNFKLLEMDYIDVLSSADLIITKPGYGMFVEAASASKPIIYIKRGAWPENQALSQFADSYITNVILEPDSWTLSNLTEAMEELFNTMPLNKTLIPDGAIQASSVIAQTLNIR